MRFDQGFADGLRLIRDLIGSIPNLDVVGYIIGYFCSLLFITIFIGMSVGIIALLFWIIFSKGDKYV